MSRILTMEAKDLVALLRNSSFKPGIDYLVVDVRDDDFVGGNIPNALHLPSHQFFSFHSFSSNPTSPLQTQLEQFQKIPKLIFHCALSKQRGPRAASLVAQHVPNHHEIYVLKGGFNQWQALYKHETDLIENYNAKLWEENWWE